MTITSRVALKFKRNCSLEVLLWLKFRSKGMIIALHKRVIYKRQALSRKSLTENLVKVEETIFRSEINMLSHRIRKFTNTKAEKGSFKGHQKDTKETLDQKS